MTSISVLIQKLPTSTQRSWRRLLSVRWPDRSRFPDIAEDHPDLPLTSTEEGGVSIWDTLCMFVDHGERLFMQVSEPFGTEWVRISCCYDHYDSYSGRCTPRHPPTEDELRNLRPECQHLWEVARDEGRVRPGAS